MTRSRFNEVKSQMNGLRSHVSAVDTFTQAKFASRQGGASAPTNSSRQGQSSPRATERSTSARQARAPVRCDTAAALPVLAELLSTRDLHRLEGMLLIAWRMDAH